MNHLPSCNLALFEIVIFRYLIQCIVVTTYLDISLVVFNDMLKKPVACELYHFFISKFIQVQSSYQVFLSGTHGGYIIIYGDRLSSSVYHIQRLFSEMISIHVFLCKIYENTTFRKAVTSI